MKNKYVSDGYYPDGKSRPLREVRIIMLTSDGWAQIEYIDTGEVTACPVTCFRKEA